MLTLQNNIGETHAGTQIGILRMRYITPNRALAETEITNWLDTIRRLYGETDKKALKEMHPIRAYTAYYKRFGYSYPVLAQLESLLKGTKAPHAENGLLQAMFLTELESMLLLAGHDAAQLTSPLQMKIATGNEAYQSISGRDVTAVPNDLLVRDDKGIISSILRGPNYPSRITDATADVLFTFYAPPGIETAYIETHLRKLEGSIKTFSPYSDTEMLRVFHRNANSENISI
jgi:DNA/RNA-binding domain of Phe-tRNA-synthetase-like protein